MGLEPLSRTQMISALKGVLPPSDGINLETLPADTLTSLYNEYFNGNFGSSRVQCFAPIIKIQTTKTDS